MNQACTEFSLPQMLFWSSSKICNRHDAGIAEVSANAITDSNDGQQRIEIPFYMQGPLRVNRYNSAEGWVSSESVGQDILIADRVAMNRAMDGDVVAIEILPEVQFPYAKTSI